MSRRLLALNVLLVAVAALSALSIVRTVTAPVPNVTAPARAGTASPPPAAPAETRGNPGNYNAVAARNLFSPTRTEAPPAASPATATARLPKPVLFGVVLRDSQPIAYLEDPVTKRVAAYRVGDSVAGGTLQKIAPDGVVVDRPDGAVDVRLHDPSKPRPPVPTPAQPPVAGVQPGMPPGTPVPPTPSPYPGAVTPPPGQAPLPGSQLRPLPPNLLRRIPPSAAPTPVTPPDARQ
jgi:hypothetical protein